MQRLNKTPEIGDTLVLRNGKKMICDTPRDYQNKSKGRTIRGENSMGGRQNWYSDGLVYKNLGTSDWDIIEVIPVKKELKVEIGDIIVTKDRGEYVCKSIDLTDTRSIKGVNSLGGFQHWDKFGETPWCTMRDLSEAYRVVKIKKPVKNPAQKSENNLEFQLRVLQKENELLVRLLLKEGRL